MNPYKAMTIVASVSAAGSLGMPVVIFGAMKIIAPGGPFNVSEGAMWAIAGMAAAPALMGIGVSYFISQTIVRTPYGRDGKEARNNELD